MFESDPTVCEERIALRATPKTKAASTAMMAITAINSTSVKALDSGENAQLCFFSARRNFRQADFIASPSMFRPARGCSAK
jgi:hypothetical protein